MKVQPTNFTNEVSAEFEGKLWEASKQYMQGDIDLHQLEEIEKICSSGSFKFASLADYYTSDANRNGINDVVDHVKSLMSSLFG